MSADYADYADEVPELVLSLSKGSELALLRRAEGKVLRGGRISPTRYFLPHEVHTRSALEWTARLNRAAAYDSFYLAVAESLGCELWTTDRRLVNAAGQPWVKMVEGR